MNPENKDHVGLGEIDKVNADLEEMNQGQSKIGKMDGQKLAEIRASTQRKLEKKSQSSKNDNKGDQKSQLNFVEELNIDMTINRVVTALSETKVKLLELGSSSITEQNQKTKGFGEKFQKEIEKYQKTLVVRQSQIACLVFIKDNLKQQNFKDKYMESFGELKEFAISLQHINNGFNIVILEEFFEIQTQFLKDYSEQIRGLMVMGQDNKLRNDLEEITKKANKLKIINSKIITLAEVFPYACVFDQNDLFSFKKNSERWQALFSKYTKYQFYGDKQTIKKSFEQLKKGLNLVNATMSILHKANRALDSSTGEQKDLSKKLANIASATSNILKCLVFKQYASHEAEVLIADPDGKLAKDIWNLPQQKMLKNLIGAGLPSIAFCQEIWIPRQFTEYLSKMGKDKLPELKIDDLQLYKKELFQYKQHKQKLQMRINSPTVLKDRVFQTSPHRQQSFFQQIFGCFKSNADQIPPRSVIYHIHGGGFISMSSFVHQAYSRIWAKNLHVPIISVDYGKAPEYPYPSGLYDCFEGYMWTLQCYHQIYKAYPQKIVLVGDSAGGNLVAALTCLLINLNLRVPDGVVLVYPALNLNYHNYTPSLLTSLTDMILPHTFLKICLKAYLREGVDTKNQYVSPIQSPDQTLKKYPRTRIFVGNKDPFHDDCCRLTERLNKNDENKAKLMIFDEFPHGFLQFDLKTQPHQWCRKATEQVENALRQLLHL